MVLRKPYAFLIKYFKLINFILSALLIYLAYRTYNIINFFNEYILNNYSGNYFQGFSEQYVSPFVYLILIIIFIGTLAIYLLLKYKNKPAKLYLTNLIYNAVFLVFLVIIKNTMVSLETTVITAESARLYRDISTLIFLPQIPILISFILRGLGFNTKKLNFESDLKDLEISEQDSEEVEIVLKKDDVKLKRNVRRFFREFKYYIKENKFMFIIISIALLIGISFILYKSLPPIIDRNYNQGDVFTIDVINYKIEDSIITNLDYNGNYLGENIYYLVMRVSIENTSNKDITLDYNNFRLIVNDRYVYPILDKGRNFIDYASDYYSNTIKANSKGIYSMVYQINENDVKKNYKIKISNGSAIADDFLVGRFNYITISPIVINKVSTVSTYNLGEEINFSNSNLGNTALTLDNALITDKYIYDYENCVNNKCNNYKDIVSINYTTNNTILIVLDYNYDIDTNIPFYNFSSNINKFTKTFMKIKYIDNKKTTYATIKDVTPSKLKGKIVLETTSKIKESEEVEISIIIRNKEYLIKIK